MAASEGAIRKCVHCGFCTAACPTYVLLGDERDSPRGRIYLMKDLLEDERVPPHPGSFRLALASGPGSAQGWFLACERIDSAARWVR